MKYDIIIAGVGGQGVLAVAATIARAAMEAGLAVRQSEVHGMAQRGGAVQSHLRLADGPIQSDIVGLAQADMILSMEPVESLRYLAWLKKGGRLVTDSNPFANIPDYPAAEWVAARVAAVPGSRMLDAKALAKKACNPKAANMVLVGAASASLPIGPEALVKAIRGLFGAKGEDIVEANLKAFALGREGA